ncbi:hypothetical protein [Paenibacillus eucommiae]|uniref:RNA polymerase subunit RPABC4/transcription elongation factor Spt4 n=1 Tax=Paenibacillus eucommiae TaxID=1355755 RepID=A0ABS4IY41_9BACL|nr:hypothetical protein [Paenibacillus eucommiae]MBP1992475.1 RNA polymerase subunit RPABC4/transcription elongation factor Spt4 [Paenibacillus eucommiae]
MKNKIAVQFRRSKRTMYAFQRLKYCKRCGSYTVLFEDDCPSCGKEDNFISITDYAKSLNKRLSLTETLVALSIFFLGIIFANSVTEMFVAIVAGGALLALYFYLRSRYKQTTEAFRFQKVLIEHTPAIYKGLQQDLMEAVGDIQAEDYKTAYEKLREISYFLNNDRIKIRKIMCLNYFVIRKDMDLELETLIPSHYDKDFVKYLWEVSKVNKQLIRINVLDYVVRYKAKIELLENGPTILTNIAGASLRMKQYVAIYQNFILEHVDYLPKDRFLRLCKIMAAFPGNDWGTLYSRSKEIVRTRYSFDPDFQGIW